MFSPTCPSICRSNKQIYSVRFIQRFATLIVLSFLLDHLEKYASEYNLSDLQTAENYRDPLKH